MMFKRLLVSLILQSLLLSTNLSVAQSDVDFALSLYRNGEYAYSLLELRRWLHVNGDSAFAPYARHLLGLCYGQTGRYAEATSILNELIDYIEEQDDTCAYERLFCETHVQLLNLHFREKRFEDFHLERERFDISCMNADARLRAGVQNMAVAVHVYSRSWEEALEEIHRAEHLDRETAGILEDEIQALNQYKLKSPVLGGVLSLVPGLGHLYGGRGMAGIRSFFINTACMGLAAFCFVMGMPVLGVLFALVEGALYVSNIYGGVNAVMGYNSAFILERRDSMLKLLIVPPLDVITFREVLFAR
jgi:tetratricopeptide (TPR) repeat protein